MAPAVVSDSSEETRSITIMCYCDRMYCRSGQAVDCILPADPHIHTVPYSISVTCFLLTGRYYAHVSLKVPLLLLTSSAHGWAWYYSQSRWP